MSLQAIYSDYVLYCLSVGTKPLSFKDWRKTSDKLRNFHDTPGSILEYRGVS